MFDQPAAEGARRIELDRLEAPAAAAGRLWQADGCPASREANAERIAERVRRISGGRGDALPGARRIEGPGSGAGRFSDPPLTRKKFEGWLERRAKDTSPLVCFVPFVCLASSCSRRQASDVISVHRQRRLRCR